MRIVSSIIVTAVLVAFWALPLRGNPASEALVLQGRTELASRHYPAAESLFAQALATDITDANASVLRAYSRVMALPERPPVKRLLDLLGTSPANRFLLRWTARLTRGADGKIVLPAGVSSQNLADSWRTNVVPELVGIEQDLARVTATNYLVTLSAQETTTVETVVDYADLQLLRAICHGGRFLSLTAYGWDWDVPLTALQSFASSTNPTFELFLKQNPEFLTFKSPADLREARQAFTDVAAQYNVASALIRIRHLADIRLFNWDPGQTRNEVIFRQALDGLKQSLDGKALYEGKINLARMVEEGFAPRRFLPKFREDHFVFGSFPDPTFGGMFPGASSFDVEHFVQYPRKFKGKGISGIEAIESVRRENGALRLDTSVQVGNSYRYQWGTVLGRWLAQTNVLAQADRLIFSVPFETDSLFVRMTLGYPFENESTFAPYRFSGDTLDIIELFPEPFPTTSDNSLWWEWIVPASGYVRAYDKSSPLGDPSSSTVLLYRGDSIFNSSEISRSTPVNKGERIFLKAVTRTRNAICRLYAEIVPGGLNDSSERAAVLSGTNAVGSVDLWRLAPGPTEPLHTGVGAAGAGWFRWIAPVAGFYLTQVNNPIVKMDVYHIDSAGTKTLVKTGEAGGLGLIAAEGEELYFALFYDSRTIYGGATLNIRKHEIPANDDFAHPVVLSGQRGEFHGDIRGSSLQEGEPVPPGRDGSVWFTWVAPITGFAEIALDGSPSVLKLSIFTGETPALIEPVTVLPPLNPFMAASSPTRFATIAGQAYRLQLTNARGFQGDYTLAFWNYLPPVNDNLADAIEVSGTDIHVEGTILGSTLENFDYRWGADIGGTVWYSWKAPASGHIHPEAKRSASEVRIDWATDPENLIWAGHDPHVLGGETYYFRVIHVSGHPGSFVFSLKFWQ
ncbi:MAG TPA: hypothetical protein VMF06_18130 [Candidatus Limnocylindria bacterium]|jgi:hypothetical protein|nr:hypothetical protein [Candidatus Limnocylindria bacterium]